MIIDYLSFSLNFECINLEYVIGLLGLEKYASYFQDIGKKSRYEHCFKMGNISICLPYSSRPDMGIFINMTGQGCRELEECHFTLFKLTFDWSAFMYKLVREVNLNHKVNITRIDLAFDDYDGKLSLPLITQKLLNGEYTSRFRHFSEVETNETFSKSGSLGKTIYIGSKSSSCYCKFYDKLAEQKRMHSTDEYMMEKLNNMAHWVRFEITFKDTSALNVCNFFVFSPDFEKDIQEYINRYFRFVDLTDVNISRCPVSLFWSDFLGTDEVSKVKVVKSDMIGHDRTYKWFRDSLTPSLFALMRTYKDINGFLYDIWEYGRTRQTARHKMIMDGVTIGRNLSNSELWELNNPYFNQMINALSGPPDMPDTCYKPYHYADVG